MHRPSFPSYLDHLRRESARFREVLSTCDPDARVPACPDWNADDLLWHLGEVQLFWATVVRTRPAAPEDSGVVPPERPDARAGLLEFFETSSADLLDQLAHTDPAAAAWSWAPEQTVGFTFRRQAHEALIHRVDAEQTAGVPVTDLDAELAADGVAELLDAMYGGEPPSWATFEPVAGLVRIDLSDVGETLWVQPGELTGTEPASGINYDGPHLVLVPDAGVEPAVVVTGTAASLDTFYWKRTGDAPRISGDDAVAAVFADALSRPLD